MKGTEMEKLEHYRDQLKGKSPEEILRWALTEFDPDSTAYALTSHTGSAARRGRAGSIFLLTQMIHRQ